METNWKLVGKVKEAHGLRGELYILLFSGEAPWQKKLIQFSLGLENEKSLKTYPLQSSRLHRDGLVIASALIKDRTAAEKLQGQFFYIPSALTETKKGERIYLREILGF